MRRNRRGFMSRFAALALVGPVLGGCASRNDRVAAGNPSATGAAPATLTGATLLTDGETPRLLLTRQRSARPDALQPRRLDEGRHRRRERGRVPGPRAPARGRRDSVASRHEVVHGDGQAPHPVRAHGARRRSSPPSPPTPARRPWRSRSGKRRGGSPRRDSAARSGLPRRRARRRSRPRPSSAVKVEARAGGHERLRGAPGDARATSTASPPAAAVRRGRRRRCPSVTPPPAAPRRACRAVERPGDRTANSSRRSRATAASRTRPSLSRTRRATSSTFPASCSRRRRQSQDVQHAGREPRARLAVQGREPSPSRASCSTSRLPRSPPRRASASALAFVFGSTSALRERSGGACAARCAGVRARLRRRLGSVPKPPSRSPRSCAPRPRRSPPRRRCRPPRRTRSTRSTIRTSRS